MARSRGTSNVAQGVYAALTTPRRSTAEVDTAALLEYVDAVVTTGVDGLVLFGSTGEFVHYELEERARSVRLAIKRSRVPVLVNVSHSTLAGAVRLADEAFHAGASGVLLMPPYFYRYRPADIFEFFRQFAAAASGDQAVYVYNIPAFTNEISSELMKNLLSLNAVRGLKDSSGDSMSLSHVFEIRKQFRFQILIGSEPVYAKARANGADGVISGVAAAVPELIVALDRCLLSGNAVQIDTLEQHLDEFVRQISQFPAPLGIRSAAALRGWQIGDWALPLSPETRTALTSFAQWFCDWLPRVLTESRREAEH